MRRSTFMHGSRPRTSHGGGYESGLKKLRGPLCSYCDAVVGTRRERPDHWHDIGRDIEYPCCDSPECRQELRKCREAK